MKKNKILTCIFLAVILSVVNSAYVYSLDAEGCCINPQLPPTAAAICQGDIWRDSECCNPAYLSNGTEPGPTTYGQCINNYFAEGDADCSSPKIGNKCDTGCCCDNYEVKYRIECEASFFPGQTNCITACPSAECSDGADNDNDDCTDYPEDNDCTSSTDNSESGSDCGAVSGCSSSGYTPKLSNLQIMPVRGEKRLELSWSDECAGTAIGYDIERCKGSGCANFATIGQSNTNYFSDSNTDLLWDSTYNYKITAHYSIPFTTPDIEKEGNLGNLECWGAYNSNYFCIHSSYYDNEPIYSYMRSNGVSKDTSKYNKAYSCSSLNLIAQEGTSCGSGTICVVNRSNQPSCYTASQCKVETGNPFGLYYMQTDCESGKYCFFDRSQTQVDSCYKCKTGMSCYDYKSEATCTRDNCNTGNCEWHSTIAALGIGACVSNAKSNCEWCNKKGTDGMENLNAYNEVFDRCTKTKSDALAVEPNYRCYYKNGSSLSCENAMCQDYTSEGDCGYGSRLHDGTNKITSPSSDSCEIGVCQWYGGETKCRKNADASLSANTEPDCSAGNRSCEADYFAPDTNMTATVDKGIYDSLSIKISDKTSTLGFAREVSSGGYKTYVCVRNDANDCGQNGHPYEKYANGLYLEINGLYLFEGGSSAKNWTLYEGINYLKYYGQDPSKNIGLVKSIAIEAHANESRPEVAKSNISGATKIGDTFYTSDSTPTITIEFYLSAEIVYNQLIGPANRTLQPNPSGWSKTFSFTPSYALEEENYIFELNAKNQNNIYMDEIYAIKFIIDNTLPALDIVPADGSAVNDSNVFFSFNFSEQVMLEEVAINGINAKGNFSSGYNTVFSANINLNEGAKELVVKARDRGGNLIEGMSVFNVNAIPNLDIKLIKPAHGVSSSPTFDIILETDNDAVCAFNLDSEMDYRLMLIGSPFDITGGTRHEQPFFNGIPDYDAHKLYVKCNDSQYGVSSKTFDLRVDETPPTILDYYAYPNPVVESHYTTTLYVRTDEGTICRYSKNTGNYYLMENEFPKSDREDYRTVHNDDITEASGNGNYSYYVACENLAELNSSVALINFGIDTGYPLTITDHSEKYSNDTSISLAFETNKITQCYYSQTDPDVVSGTLFGPSGYDHVISKTVANGKYTFYVKCLDPGIGDWSYISTTIIADSTKPYMIFVSDNSSIVNNSEKTWMTDMLRATWLGNDNETGTIGGSRAVKYFYMVEEYAAPRQVLVNWTLTSEEYPNWIIARKHTNGSNFQLTDGEKYRFRVKPKNIVDLIGDEMPSDGIEVCITCKPANCGNGFKDGSESDTDCGGGCDLCGLNKTCSINSDCESDYCSPDKKCDMQTCSDGVKQPANGETDADCGGETCQPCDDGKNCNIDSDCESSYCDHGKCGLKDSCSDGELSAGESDTDCGGPCPDRCGIEKYCKIETDCESGLKCVNGKCAECAGTEDCSDGIDNDCDGLVDKDDSANCEDTDGDGMPDDWEIENGLDPNDPNDRNLDKDNDGLTNIEEYNIRNTWYQSTDPGNIDTDGDGFSDKTEADAGTDPTSAESYPKRASRVWSILLLALGVLVLLGGGGYIVYAKLVKPKETTSFPPPMPTAIRVPQKTAGQITRLKPQGITPENKRLAELIKRKKEEKIEQRKKLFESFKTEEEKEQIKKPEEKIGKKEEKKPDIKKPASEKPLKKAGKKAGAIERLKKLEKEKPKREVFEELKKIAKKKK